MTDPIRAALQRLMFDIDCLTNSSSGVAGLHLNGDLVPWPDLLEEGIFSLWLGDAVTEARAALAATPPAPAAEEAEEGRWSEGVCGDGAAILRDGVMVPIEEVIKALNRIPVTSPTTADPPAVPKEPTDEELYYLAEEFNGDQIPTLRAALARWGRPATPPAPAAGEVEELVAALRKEADAWFQLKNYGKWASKLTRTAALLEQLSAAQALPIPTTPPSYCWEVRTPDGDGTAGGVTSTAEDAEREGRHCLAQYQQDGPHGLRLWVEYSILEPFND